MRSFAIEHLTELLEVVGYTVASLLVSLLGVGVEGAGITNLLSGDPTLGLWEVFMGAVALYVGFYLLGYREAVPRLLARRS